MFCSHWWHVMMMDMAVNIEFFYWLHVICVPYFNFLVPAGGTEHSCVCWVPLSTFNLKYKTRKLELLSTKVWQLCISAGLEYNIVYSSVFTLGTVMYWITVAPYLIFVTSSLVTINRTNFIVKPSLLDNRCVINCDSTVISATQQVLVVDAL